MTKIFYMCATIIFLPQPNRTWLSQQQGLARIFMQKVTIKCNCFSSCLAGIFELMYVMLIVFAHLAL